MCVANKMIIKAKLNIFIIILILIHLQYVTKCENFINVNKRDNSQDKSPLNNFLQQLLDDSRQKNSYLALDGQYEHYTRSNLQFILQEKQYYQAIELTGIFYLFNSEL